ncbi:D-Ala-D-Ala carboxypeptidase family metallohydrolase [Parabacteroides distasonis]|nr:D-Ala-D-Ala carboxypeptidase family metallohydrolase [Parabacteroides distasonis]UVP70865.1 D-Ala-D-Ala carboxypeptidase family metallohydrolase [Parabacteroides distasonis]
MSGYRSEELNRLVGGAPSSQHMKGGGGRHLHGGPQPTIGGLGGKPPEF